MDRRTLFIMIAASWVLVAFMMFNAPQPKPGDKKNADEKEQVAQNEDGDNEQKQDGDPAKNGEQDDQKKADDKSADPSADKSDSKTGDSKTGDKQKTEDQDTEKKSSDAEQEKESKPSPRKIEQKFISLGSLATDSPYRFLVTLNNAAASVHRLELVQRHKKNDRLKYKDLEVRYGYLGHLDLQSQGTAGCLVKTVGPGTPAHVAGIKVGDEIISFNGEPVETRLEFETELRKTKPGDEVSIGLRRTGNEQTVTANLTRQPLEVIRPTVVPELAEFAFERVELRKSFAVSIFNPSAGTQWKSLGQAHEAVWESEVGEDYVKFYYPYKSERKPKKLISIFK